MPTTKRRAAQRRALRWAQCDLCAGCGAFLPSGKRLPRHHPESPTFDHVIVRSEGGGRTLTNGLLKHQRCNQQRGHKPATGCDLLWLDLVQSRLVGRPKSFKTMFRGGVPNPQSGRARTDDNHDDQPKTISPPMRGLFLISTGQSMTKKNRSRPYDDAPRDRTIVVARFEYAADREAYDAYVAQEARPFLDGLLPEEWQREAAARVLGISSGNPFRLLKALGGDAAGALTFWPGDGAAQPEHADAGAAAEALGDDALAQLFDRMVQRPMLAGEGRRYSLAGAQSKLPVVLDRDGRVALAKSGQATTHIIKPEPARFAGLAANEAFCLALAAAVGLETAAADWRSVEGRPYLLVRRYDRAIENGETTRLHQEDFAQALGVMSAKKYASDGGPVFRDCFALVRRAATHPEREVLKLIDAALFNLVIGNADAHAKNYSLLRHANGTIVLAPLYDLVATAAWPELSPRMAMKYGRARMLEDMCAGSFERFAADAGVEFDIVRKRGLALAYRLIGSLDSDVVVRGLEDPHVRSLIAPILDRAGRVALKLAI